MAFVVKSPKISTFDELAHQNQMQSLKKGNELESDSKAKRIHAAKNQGKLLFRNPLQEMILSGHQKSVSIPANKLLFYYSDEEEQFKKFILKKKYERMKQLVNHRKVKEIKKQEEPDYKFYDIPSTFSQKKKKQIINLKQKENLFPWVGSDKETTMREEGSPGPGFYQIQQNSSICGPKFQNSTSCSLKPLLNQISQKTYRKEEKLFPIKYEYMNSPFYRQPSNNTKSSNNQLLTKIFGPRSGNSTANTQNDQDPYEPVNQSSPDPATYFQSSSKDKKSPMKNQRCFISGQMRFKNSSSSVNLQVSPVSYFISPQSIESNQSPAFYSGSNRFTMREEDDRNIQNQNRPDILLKHSHNRSNIPFSSLLSRKNAQFFKEMEDQSGFYYNELENKWVKDNCPAVFSVDESKRKVFESLNNFPGPGSYLQQPTDFVFKKKPMKKPSKNILKTALEKQKKKMHAQSSIKIGNRQSIQLERNPNPNAPRNCSPPQKLRKQYKKIEKVQEELNSKYELPDPRGSWLKKSFNRLFVVDQILNANNPTQWKDYFD